MTRDPDLVCVNRSVATGREAAEPDAKEAEVLARAAAGGYAMVGPSARTWSVDLSTGIPTGPVAEAEHRLVRDLIAQERLDGGEPVWLPCADGGQEIVAAVVVNKPGDDGDGNGDTAGRDGRPVVARAPAEARLSDQTRPADVAERGDLTGGEQQTGRDPAGLGARLTELDALAAAGEPGGGWRTVSAARAADELTGRGYDRDTAAAMVAGYLRDTAERVGVPVAEVGGWGLDQGDLDAIALGHRLPGAALGALAEQDHLDAARADQLGRWHTDDHTDHTADDYPAAYDGAGEVDAAVRAADAPALGDEFGATDGAEGSW